MLTLLTRYVSVGVINTLIHWLAFATGHYLLNLDQMISNLLAFIIAVSFSFFANAKWTFKSSAGLAQYIIFTAFMGIMALVVGYTADKIRLAPLLTLIVFSSLSMIFGFLFSNFIVFRRKI
ncbi:putative flippase GtrA [Erwinia persicina]|uniref:GtrA family protein n=1 Tax=Erwinia persicina TaxID=55211 RepID=UPI00209D13CF|nr:GtrA family protein [Erwinia persicina]MCP1440498.1 putative flippase GtrA [Erwinia persicina]